ncbi:MAG: D-alanine--D-alanine ligase family protein [Opitutales bacterium]
MKNPKICILYGGVGNERSVSLESGKAVVEALSGEFNIIDHDLTEASLPGFVKGEDMLVFPVLHGRFGEDGRLQAQLEAAGVEYCGCDAGSSALCIDKVRTKEVASRAGAHVVESLAFEASELPSYATCVDALGEKFVIKPSSEGSSVDLFMIDDEKDFVAACKNIVEGSWMAEKRVIGLETSIGILNGKAQGVVAIKPAGGVYDYAHKYTAGGSTYEFPARISDVLTSEIQATTERIFEKCGCRDYARVDYILESGKKPVFLEINSLPGLTPTSLLPKSVSCNGFSFLDLLKAMLSPAIARWSERYGN